MEKKESGCDLSHFYVNSYFEAILGKMEYEFVKGTQGRIYGVRKCGTILSENTDIFPYEESVCSYADGDVRDLVFGTDQKQVMAIVGKRGSIVYTMETFFAEKGTKYSDYSPVYRDDIKRGKISSHNGNENIVNEDVYKMILSAASNSKEQVRMCEVTISMPQGSKNVFGLEIADLNKKPVLSIRYDEMGVLINGVLVPLSDCTIEGYRAHFNECMRELEQTEYMRHAGLIEQFIETVTPAIHMIMRNNLDAWKSSLPETISELEADLDLSEKRLKEATDSYDRACAEVDGLNNQIETLKAFQGKIGRRAYRKTIGTID